MLRQKTRSFPSTRLDGILRNDEAASYTAPPNAMTMKRIFLSLAAAIALFAIAFWSVRGAHRGWTKTSVAVKSVDEVTGLEGISYQSRFVPGLDFLGGALLAAGILAGASFVFRNKTNPQLKSENK